MNMLPAEICEKPSMPCRRLPFWAIQVDEETIYQITSTAKPEEIRNFIKTALSGDFVGARAASG